MLTKHGKPVRVQSMVESANGLRGRFNSWTHGALKTYIPSLRRQRLILVWNRQTTLTPIYPATEKPMANKPMPTKVGHA